MVGRRKLIAAKHCQGLGVKQGTQEETGLLVREEGRAMAQRRGSVVETVSECRERSGGVWEQMVQREVTGACGKETGHLTPLEPWEGWRHPESAVRSSRCLFGTERHHHCTLASSSSRLLVWLRPQWASRGQ